MRPNQPGSYDPRPGFLTLGAFGSVDRISDIFSGDPPAPIGPDFMGLPLTSTAETRSGPRRLVGNIALGAVLGLALGAPAGVGLIGGIYSVALRSPEGFKVAPEVVKEGASVVPGLFGCKPASHQAIRAVEDIFSARYPSAQIEGSVQDEIESLGLTPVDRSLWEPYAALVVDSESTNPEITLKEYLAFSERVNNQFGVDFDVPKTGGLFLYDPLRPVAQMSEREKNQIRNAIVNHTGDLLRIPIEMYRDYFGVEGTKLVDLGPTRSGIFGRTPRKIYLSPLTRPGTTIHEAAHVQDKKNCGTISRAKRDDTAIERNNPRGYYIGIKAYDDIQMNGSQAELNDLFEASNGISVEMYGAATLMEDKATITAAMFNGKSMSKLFSANNPLRAKAIELLGRMYDKNPQYVHFLHRTYYSDHSE